MSTQLRLSDSCLRPYPCECRRCKPLSTRRAGTIQGRILTLLSDGRQRTVSSIAGVLQEGADTVARELRKLRASNPLLRCVVVPGHRRAVWFLVSA